MAFVKQSERIDMHVLIKHMWFGSSLLRVIINFAYSNLSIINVYVQYKHTDVLYLDFLYSQKPGMETDSFSILFLLILYFPFLLSISQLDETIK